MTGSGTKAVADFEAVAETGSLQCAARYRGAVPSRQPAADPELGNRGRKGGVGSGAPFLQKFSKT